MVADEKRNCQIGYRVSCLDCCLVKRLNRTCVTGGRNISQRHSFKPFCYQDDMLWNILNWRQTIKFWTHTVIHVFTRNSFLCTIVHNSTNWHCEHLHIFHVRVWYFVFKSWCSARFVSLFGSFFAYATSWLKAKRTYDAFCLNPGWEYVAI